MSIKALHAMSSLYRRFIYECKHFDANQREMEKLADGYFRYRDLLHQQRERSDRIVNIFGVLGVHSPDVSKEMAKQIQDAMGMAHGDAISSKDVRDKLKLWEILEMFLASVDNKSTVSDFRSFLFKVDMQGSVSAQAINSAVKTHPELFDEMLEEGQKFLVLKSTGS